MNSKGRRHKKKSKTGRTGRTNSKIKTNKTKGKVKKIRRKSSKVKKGRTKSNSKRTWEKFLKNKESVSLLKRSWGAKNPQKHYRDTIVKLSRKFSNRK